MDGEAWWATVHEMKRVEQSTKLNNLVEQLSDWAHTEQVSKNSKKF